MSTLHPINATVSRPKRFTYPFCYEPHPLCMTAAEEVKHYVGQHEELRLDAERGKMFGVMVAADAADRLFFLAAYSGLLAGRNDWTYFVPPVFDAQQPDGHFKQTERRISDINHQLAAMAPDEGEELREQRRRMSEDLQRWLFQQYRMLNAHGETKDLIALWSDYHKEKVRRKFPLPPGGTGDCCAPKLLQYAYLHQLRPVCMAEFWYGASPKGEIRHHGHYYPACRGKCKPILTWMLQGLDVDPDPESLGFPHLNVETVYEDDHLLVINKPSGLLSTQGRIEQYCVQAIMSERYPGSIVAHRLDMWTSGTLIVAKSLEVYHHLQEQFIKRTVKKRYVALLEREPQQWKGTISLPLRPDIVNRPRQVVDHEHGKQAITDYEYIGQHRILLYPKTGRTHQLRIHCAHAEGLNSPIRGDELYGQKADRLYLHAEAISFIHPVTGQPMHFEVPPPF